MNLLKPFTRNFIMRRCVKRTLKALEAPKSRSVIKSAESIINVQPKRTQAYYDIFAKELESGATYVNERTGHVIHTKGFGKNNFNIELYKLKSGMTPEEIVKNEKCLFQLKEDPFYGLIQYDRYLSHGDQNANYLTTWNAQRRVWNGSSWNVTDINPYMRYQTYYVNNSHSLFGNCLDEI